MCTGSKHTHTHTHTHRYRHKRILSYMYTQTHTAMLISSSWDSCVQARWTQAIKRCITGQIIFISKHLKDCTGICMACQYITVMLIRRGPRIRWEYTDIFMALLYVSVCSTLLQHTLFSFQCVGATTSADSIVIWLRSFLSNRAHGWQQSTK